MPIDTRIREAIQDSIREFGDRQAAALDSLVDTIVQTAVADSEAELAEVRAKAEAGTQEAIEVSLARARAEAEDLRVAALAAAGAEADASLASALRDARAEAEMAAAGMLAEAQRSQVELQRARADVERLRAEVEKAAAAAAAKPAPVAAARPDGGAARLLESIRTLDATHALTDVFDTLADLARKEADRAAILIVRGGQLRAWRFVGFEGAPDPRTVGMKLDGAGIIAEVVRTGQTRTAGPESSALGFAPLPTGRTGVVAPIEVGGQVVAVLYVDDATRESAGPGDAWRDGVEILARHAARCLEVLTVQHSQQATAAKAVPASPPRPEPVAAGQAR
jgi:hypothetical protein